MIYTLVALNKSSLRTARKFVALGQNIILSQLAPK